MAEVMNSDACVRFAPSKVIGLADVTEVAVFGNRLEVKTDDRVATFPFQEFFRRQQPLLDALMRRLLRLRPYPLIVGERDWFFERNEDRFFRFLTEPQLTIFMPPDDATDYAQSYFYRIRDVMLRGGYDTYDLG